MTKTKKIFILIIFIQLVYTQYNTAHAHFFKTNTWYIGNRIGLPKYNNIISYIDEIIICKNINDSVYNSCVSFGTFIGYQTKQCFSFELGYNCLGKITYSNEEIHSSLNVQNVDISTKLYHPIINDKLSIYTKLGGAIWHANVKNIYYNNDYHLSFNDTNISPLLSLGLEYTIKKNWSTRLEYQKINHVGNINTIGAQSNHTMLNLSILYYFK